MRAVDCASRRHKISVMALIRNLFWLTIFLASTFGFIVLFEHGPKDYVNNCKATFENLQKLVNKKVERKKDESDKVVP